MFHKFKTKSIAYCSFLNESAIQAQETKATRMYSIIFQLVDKNLHNLRSN